MRESTLGTTVMHDYVISGTCVQYLGLQGAGALGDASTPCTPAGSKAASTHGVVMSILPTRWEVSGKFPSCAPRGREGRFPERGISFPFFLETRHVVSLSSI